MTPCSLALTRFKKLTASTLPKLPELPSLRERPSFTNFKLAETPKDKVSKYFIDGDGNLIVRNGDSDRLGRLVDKGEVGNGPDQCKVLHHEAGADGEEHGYAVIPSKGHPTSLLTVALGDVTGIEDSDLYDDDDDNYFADAWENVRQVTAKSLGYENVDDLPHDGMALAVNSQNERSQDRLHIHADKLDPELGKQLKDKLDHGEFSSKKWTNVDPGNGHQYRAIWVDGANLDNINPFKIVRDKVVAEHGGGAFGEEYARTHMGQHSILVVPQTDANGRKGFLIIDGRAGHDAGRPGGPHDSGHAEEWLIGRGGGPAEQG